MNLKNIDAQYTADTYARCGVAFVRGSGSLLYDEAGKEYIDLGSGIAVNSFGSGNEAWVAAVTKQAQTLAHASNLYCTAPQALLAQTLCERTGLQKVFFSNSGAEANECAIKAARKYASDKYGDSSHSTIITLQNSFHGRTLTTVSATGQAGFHEHFAPFTQGFVYAEPNNIESIKALLHQNRCCAIMIELIQGEGGVCVLEQAFVSEIAALCAAHGLLLIIDEVQTGNGRTGELYCYMHYNLAPDIVTTAKGLGGGLPIGATLFGEKTKHTLTAGTHGSTFGGNPVCCAGAQCILDMINAPLLTEVKAKGEYIVNQLQHTKGVKAVRGMGLMLGIETEKDAKEVVRLCMERGVVCLTAKAKVRLLPALNIPFELLAQAIEVLKSCLG